MPPRPDAFPPPEAAPQGWSIVCASGALKTGSVRRARLMGREVVAFRDGGGRAAVLAPHCPHMGAHLGAGTVGARGLTCPLHGWAFDTRGTCVQASGGEEVERPGALYAYPTEERYGAIFAFNGPKPTHALPTLPEPLVTRVGNAVTVEAPWEVVSANGFDVNHLSTVHGRTLRAEPTFGASGDSTFALEYASRVTGRTLADRAVQAASGDRIHVSLRSFAGTLILAESTIRGSVNRLLVSLAPDERGTEVTPLFAARGSGPRAWARARVAAALFRSFLAPDADALRGIAFHPPRPSPADAAFLDYLAFLHRQPTFDGPPTRG